MAVAVEVAVDALEVPTAMLVVVLSGGSRDALVPDAEAVAVALLLVDPPAVVAVVTVGAARERDGVLSVAYGIEGAFGGVDGGWGAYPTGPCGPCRARRRCQLVSRTRYLSPCTVSLSTTRARQTGHVRAFFSHCCTW